MFRFLSFFLLKKTEKTSTSKANPTMNDKKASSIGLGNKLDYRLREIKR
jgi:hypothetical protein